MWYIVNGFVYYLFFGQFSESKYTIIISIQFQYRTDVEVSIQRKLALFFLFRSVPLTYEENSLQRVEKKTNLQYNLSNNLYATPTLLQTYYNLCFNVLYNIREFPP